MISMICYKTHSLTLSCSQPLGLLDKILLILSALKNRIYKIDKQTTNTHMNLLALNQNYV